MDSNTLHIGSDTLSLADAYPREFATWEDMIARCYDPSHPNHCGSWQKSFDGFLLDMGPMPS
jgi:hypothetical protein